MKTRIKLGDILAVQCLNITTIASKVLKWVMAYFSTIVVLATSMMFAGSGEKVEEATIAIAMTMLIIAVVALCTSYLIGLLLSILIKYVILAEDSKSYMLRSLDRVTTLFAIIIGAVTISVPIVERQVSNALYKLIFCVCLYLLLLVVKRIIIHFLPERIFVSEKHEYVSHHLKYSWMTFNSAIGTATQISPNTLAKVTDKFEDIFHLSMDDSENVEPDNNHTEIDDIPALHTADSLRLPKYTEITRVIPESAPITRFRDKYPFKNMGPVNNHKLPLEYPLRIIGTGYMPHVVASVSNISYESNDASDASNDASDASEDESDASDASNDASDASEDDASDDDDESDDDDDDGPYSHMGDIVI